jgi:hypothetical protein
MFVIIGRWRTTIGWFSGFPAVYLPGLRFFASVVSKCMITCSFPTRGKPRKIFTLSFPVRQGTGEAALPPPKPGADLSGPPGSFRFDVSVADNLVSMLPNWRPCIGPEVVEHVTVTTLNFETSNSPVMTSPQRSFQSRYLLIARRLRRTSTTRPSYDFGRYRLPVRYMLEGWRGKN